MTSTEQPRQWTKVETWSIPQFFVFMCGGMLIIAAVFEIFLLEGFDIDRLLWRIVTLMPLVVVTTAARAYAVRRDRRS